MFPDFIFVTSWEVCNKVGGIYTVLSTRAMTLQKRMHDHVIFIGPEAGKIRKIPFSKKMSHCLPTGNSQRRMEDWE